MLDEKGKRFRTRAFSQERVRKALPCAFCLELGALEATEGSPRTWGRVCACAERVDDEETGGTAGGTERYPALAYPWGHRFSLGGNLFCNLSLGKEDSL